MKLNFPRLQGLCWAAVISFENCITNLTFKLLSRVKTVFIVNEFPWTMQKLFNHFLDATMGNYSSSELKGDCISALNVAMLAVPQGMAYALIAGLPVYYGIIGSGIASILGGIFGGKKFITLGPTNATAVLLFGMFANLGMIQRSGQISESAIIMVPCILFASGLILLFASLLRVSFFVKFISRTVITAYITAASLLIIANQLKNTLGITALPEIPLQILLLPLILWCSISHTYRGRSSCYQLLPPFCF